MCPKEFIFFWIFLITSPMVVLVRFLSVFCIFFKLVVGNRQVRLDYVQVRFFLAKILSSNVTEYFLLYHIRRHIMSGFSFSVMRKLRSEWFGCCQSDLILYEVPHLLCICFCFLLLKLNHHFWRTKNIEIRKALDSNFWVHKEFY